MQFAHSIWLLAGVAACGILALSFYLFQKRSNAALRQFASDHLLSQLTKGVSPRKRLLKRVILILAVAAIFTALARPQMGFTWKEVKRKGIDILLAVDTSKSMLANDVTPNRLERSKFGIMDFVDKLEGDRVGLLPFAGTAFLMCPMTLDHEAFRNALDALDTNIIPQGGTDLASAIREAEFAFSNDDNHKILVLVTDGEDLEGEALAAAQSAAGKGLTIYTVGVGTPSGELIPITTQNGGEAFVKDEQGQPVKSRLDETMLKQIAEVTGGRYEPLGRKGEGLEAIYQEKLSLVPKRDLAERMQKVPIERFEWPLMAALLLLLMEFAISDRRRLGKRKTFIKTAYRRMPKAARTAGVTSAALLILLTLVFVGFQAAHASTGNAEEAYHAGNFDAAMKAYHKEAEKKPDMPGLQFNLGAAAYKNKAYDQALGAFQKALEGDDIELQNQSYYNMGNTLYRQGELAEKKQPQETIKRWEASIAAYDGALKLNPQDADAAFNREFVKKRLENLKKKQKDCNQCNNKNDQKNQKNQENKQDNSNKNDNKDQNKNQQAKNQQKDQKQDSRKNPDKEKQHQKSAKNQQDTGKDQQKQAQTSPEQQPNKKSQAQAKSGSKPTDRKNKDSAKLQPGQRKDPQKQKTQTANAKRQRRPGQMTEEQAKRLLDSLKGDEKAMPMTAMGAAGNPEERKRRDW